MDLRQACGRYHDKMLRLPNSPSCSRYARANVACVLFLVRQRGHYAHTSPEAQLQP
ncbi:hypothetical protein V8C44DRAFT_337188 [Trichoderma aethiopicum]